MPELECPLCKGPHTLSQCPHWKPAKRAFRAVLISLLLTLATVVAVSDRWWLA